MTRNTVILQRARLDLIDARNWYERQNAGLGDEFSDEIGRLLVKIEQSPEAYQVIYKQFRRGLTLRFPYRIFYRLTAESVVVVRILHTSRDHTREL